MAGADDDLELDPTTPVPEPGPARLAREEIDPGPPIDVALPEQGNELELAVGPARPRGIDPGPGLGAPVGALEIIGNAPPDPAATRSPVELPLSEAIDLAREKPVPSVSDVCGIIHIDDEAAEGPMAIDRSQLPFDEEDLTADDGPHSVALVEGEADEPMELEADPRDALASLAPEPAPTAKAGDARADAPLHEIATARPAKEPARLARDPRPAVRVSLVTERLDAVLAELAAMPEIDTARGRAIVVRRLLGELSSIEAPDVLGELLVYALLRLPVSPSDRLAIEAGLIERLPAILMLRACATLASLSALQDGEVWLSTAARIICSVASRHVRRLDSCAIDLARALAEHGAGLTPRLDPDLRDWARAGRYLRASAEEATVAATALDSATAAYEYAAELAALERAVRLLVAAGLVDSVAPLVAKLGLHRDPAGAPFAERAQMASESFERLARLATRGRPAR